jgi:hypothetical protein
VGEAGGGGQRDKSSSKEGHVKIYVEKHCIRLRSLLESFLRFTIGKWLAI